MNVNILEIEQKGRVVESNAINRSNHSFSFKNILLCNNHFKLISPSYLFSFFPLFLELNSLHAKI